MGSGRRIGLLLLAWAGAVLCVHLYLQEKAGFTRGCWGLGGSASVAGGSSAATGGWVDCALVSAANPLAEFGISLATVGFVYWAGLIVLAGAWTRLFARRAGRLVARIYTGAGAGIAVGLVVWMFAATGKGCPLCLLDAALALAAAVVAWWPLKASAAPEEAAVPEPQSGPATVHAGGVLLLVLVLVWINGVGQAGRGSVDRATFWTLLEEAIDPTYLDEMAPCGFGRQAEVAPGWEALAEEMGLTLPGAEGSPVEWVYFFSPLCPVCAEVSPTLDRVAAALAPGVEMGQLRYTPQPVLFDPEFDEASILLEAVREEPLYEDLKAIMFAFQGQLSSMRGEGLRELFEAVAGEGEAYPSAARLAAAAERLERVTARMRDAGVDGLPAVFINGKRLPGSRRNYSTRCLLEILAKKIGAEMTDRRDDN